MQHDVSLGKEDIELLNSLGIDVINPNRKYWFLRTQSGTYFDDFVFEHFVGIEWDELCDLEFIKNNNQEEIKKEVQKHYPKVGNPGYIAGQIKRFVQEMKKGDIVLIPSEKSGRIAFGEIIENDAYIYEEDEFETFLNSEEDESDSKQVIKKRRNVIWHKIVKKSDLDPYLYRVIYAHNTIVDITPSAIFIDRFLSQFYVKGEMAYLTFKVNKKYDIPYSDILSFLTNNSKIIEYINKYSYNSFNVNINDIIIKMNVQSKGPVQFTGKMKSVICLGLFVAFLCGADFDITFMKACQIKYKTEGISTLIKTVAELIDSNESDSKQRELEELKARLEDDKEKLQLGIPDNISLPAEKQTSVNNDK